MSFKDKLSAILRHILDVARSTDGRNLGVFLVFVVIAFIFWALMSLENEVQRDFDLPVELDELPDSLTVIQDFPATISVGIRAKGSQLLPFMFSSTVDPMKVKFTNSSLKNNRIIISRAKLEARLREYFGSGVTITSCRPDSLYAVITSLPGKRIPLEVSADITPDIQYTVSGAITASVDSVTVYSVNPIPADITSISTETLVSSGLRDTSRFEVKVRTLPGMRIVPDEVTLTVPVEPLIAKKRMIPVEILNRPADKNVILFPSSIEISYLVPMSAYNEEVPMAAYADYNAISPGVSRLPLFLSTPGGSMRNVSMSTDFVEFVIENL